MRYYYEIQIQDPETGLWTVYEKQVAHLEAVKGWFRQSQWRDRAIQRQEVLAIVREATKYNGDPLFTLKTKIRVIELSDSIHHWKIVWEKGDWV